jgi:hypothetical protein
LPADLKFAGEDGEHFSLIVVIENRVVCSSHSAGAPCRKHFEFGFLPLPCWRDFQSSPLMRRPVGAVVEVAAARISAEAGLISAAVEPASVAAVAAPLVAVDPLAVVRRILVVVHSVPVRDLVAAAPWSAGRGSVALISTDRALADATSVVRGLSEDNVLAVAPPCRGR